MNNRSTLLTNASGPLYWLLFAASLWVLFRGHNAPGGGFIGGLLAVTASSLLATTQGVAAAQRKQRVEPIKLAAIGVVLALLSGLVGPLLGAPFLTHIWWGGLSTVLAFDLGVFLAVWGALTGYIYPLLEGEGEPS
jgi:multicomponent Na+:H+ antiporter subunit B